MRASLPQSGHFCKKREPNIAMLRHWSSALTNHRYLIADYGRRNFSVSQCSWDAGAQEHIVAIISPLDTVPTQHLSHGQIAGILVASIVGLGILIVLILKLKDKALFGIAGSEKPELDGADLSYQEKDDGNPQEIDGQEHLGNEVDGTRLPGHEG